MNDPLRRPREVEAHRAAFSAGHSGASELGWLGTIVLLLVLVIGVGIFLLAFAANTGEGSSSSPGVEAGTG
jgi:hypothetical protein